VPQLHKSLTLHTLGTSARAWQRVKRVQKGRPERMLLMPDCGRREDNSSHALKLE
jgi:hypothetical protein